MAYPFEEKSEQKRINNCSVKKGDVRMPLRIFLTYRTVVRNNQKILTKNKKIKFVQKEREVCPKEKNIFDL